MASTFISRTLASNGQEKGTISGWFKLGVVDNSRALCSTYSDANNHAMILLSSINNLDFFIEEALVGRSAYDQTGFPLPKETLNAARKSDAIMLGAVGGPKWDDLDYQYRPERALLGLRSELDLFANFRPAILSEYLTDSSSLKAEKLENLDLLIIRELTGGI